MSLAALDDDAPLTALAAKKPSKFDDDTPLASLASLAAKSKPPAGGAARPAARGKGGGKGSRPRAVPKAKRRGADSSSESSSSSSSDSSSSGDSAAPKTVSKTSKLKLLKRKKEEQADLDEMGGPIRKKDRTPKEQVVAELLCRWWYAIGEWPPDDEEYYLTELQKRKMRKVSVQEWEWVPEEDEKGFHKVYELSQFRGVFRRSTGDLVDCRPAATCPSYTNYMKKDLPELYQMLVTAYENQLKDLPNSKYNEDKLRKELQMALVRVRDQAHQTAQVSSKGRR